MYAKYFDATVITKNCTQNFCHQSIIVLNTLKTKNSLKIQSCTTFHTSDAKKAKSTINEKTKLHPLCKRSYHQRDETQERQIISQIKNASHTIFSRLVVINTKTRRNAHTCMNQRHANPITGPVFRHYRFNRLQHDKLRYIFQFQVTSK